jgi:hypothetical protein
LKEANGILKHGNGVLPATDTGGLPRSPLQLEGGKHLPSGYRGLQPVTPALWNHGKMLMSFSLRLEIKIFMYYTHFFAF